MNAPAALSAGVKGSCFHLSKVSSLSHGLSLLCVEGMMDVMDEKAKDGGS